VAFDLDGTLYFGDTVADGAVEIVQYLRDSGVTVLFFTNNSAKTRAQVVEKLVGMSLPAAPSNTYTSASATAAYLRRQGWDRVAVLGTDGLKAELVAGGVQVAVKAADAQALVVGLVPGFDFAVRPALLEAVPADMPIVACNMDMAYPVEHGERRPGCGAIVHAVESWCGRTAHAVVGKPGVFMLEELCRDHGLTPAAVLVVGDNVDSDVAMALRTGSPWVLVGGEGAPPPGGLAVQGLRDLQRLIEESCVRFDGVRS